MKTKFFLCLVFYTIFLIGCCSEQAEKEIIKERSTLQDIVDNTNAGEEIDLSQYDNITNYNAVVSKQLTIKNGTLSNAKLIIEADDVKLSGLKDVNVETSKLLGKGKLTITDSKLNDLLLSGGGSDSVYILGMSTVINLTMNYPDVRALLGDGVTVDSLKMQQDAIIQSETYGTAIITDLELIGISTLANIGGGLPEKHAGGDLDIANINFIGENTQINLNGDISAGKIIAGATSRIITNEHKLNINNTDISVSSDSPNSTTLTVVNSAEMIPENLMAIGIKPSYIAGETLNKSDIVLMEELRITGDAVMYKKGENATESVEKIWIKKSDFDIEIIGYETLTFPAEVGGYTIRITCDDLIFEETINLVSTDENLGNITVALTQEEPRISLYVDEGYGYNLYSDDIEKPNGNNFVPTLLAVVDLPENYTVRRWYLNGEWLEETNVLIMLPLENYGNMLRMGMNTISVVVTDENEGKFLSDKFDFNYGTTVTAE